jgi:hypothetical protein
MATDLILMSVQVETNNPGPGRKTSQALRVRCEAWQALLQLSNDRVEVVNTRLGNSFSRNSSQTCSCGFSSGAYGGRGTH